MNELISFRNTEHKRFYAACLDRCGAYDMEHQALFYTLGISARVREMIEHVYNFSEGLINPDCICEEWQTSSTLRTVRLAFNLFNGSVPTALAIENTSERLTETENYSVINIFYDYEYAPYFWEACRIRFGY